MNKLSRNPSDSGLIFHALIWLACLVLWNTLLRPDQQIDLRYYGHPELNKCLEFLLGVMIAAVLGLAHYAAQSPRPFWYRCSLPLLLLTGFVSLLGAVGPEQSTSFSYVRTLVRTYRIPSGALTIVPITAAIGFAWGHLMRILLGNVQLIRFCEPAARSRYALDYSVKLWQWIVTATITLVAYLGKDLIPSSWQFFPSSLDGVIVLVFIGFPLAATLYQLPILAVSRISNRWLALLVWQLLVLVICGGAWWGAPHLSELLDSLSLRVPPDLGAFPIGFGLIQATYGIVLCLSRSLPYAFGSPRAATAVTVDPTHSPTDGDFRPLGRWLWAPVLLLVGGPAIWFSLNQVHHHVDFLTFLATEKSTALRDAQWVADFKAYLQAHPLENAAGEDGKLAIEDSLVGIYVSVRRGPDPHWQALQDRLQPIQPPPAIIYCGTIDTPELLQPGQPSYQLRGSQIHLSDLPLGSAPSNLILENCLITAADWARIPPRCVVELRGCDFQWETFASVPQETQANLIFQNPSLDTQTMELVSRLGGRVRIENLTPIANDPRRLVQLCFGSPNVHIAESVTNEQILGEQGLSYPPTVITENLQAHLPPNLTTSRLMTDQDGNIIGLSSIEESSETIRLLKTGQIEYLQISQLDWLNEAAKRDSELNAALAKVRHVATNGRYYDNSLRELPMLFPNLESLAIHNVSALSSAKHLLGFRQLRRLWTTNVTGTPQELVQLSKQLEVVWQHDSANVGIAKSLRTSLGYQAVDYRITYSIYFDSVPDLISLKKLASAKPPSSSERKPEASSDGPRP